MNFPETKLSDVIDEISMGPFGSNIKVECFQETGIPVLNGSNLMGFKLGEESFRYVSEEKADSLGKANASKGDVVITHRGTLGQIIYIPQDSKYDRYVISQSQFRIRFNKQKALPEYIVYYFHTTEGQHRLLMNASQVGVPALARPSTSFPKVSIPLPPLPTQQRIASILSSLDAKIENNNKINAKLEEIAQNLFKEWFVDFGPFKNGKFEESELGLIPEGWRVGTLREIADNITDGVHNSVEDDENSAYYLLSCKNIKGGTLSIDNKDRKISQSTFLQLRKRTKLAKGDILVSSVGTIGEVMLLNEDPHNYEFQRSVAIIKPLANVSTSEFIYETLKVKNIELKHLAHGAVQQCIFISDLSGFKIVIPPCSIVDTFSEKTKSLFEIIALNNKQNTKLATLRDTLLPKLMSGEIEV